MKLSAYDIECLQAAKQKIDKDISVHHSISEIAHHIGMGSTRLKSAFKKYYGQGLYAYLLDQRMTKAKQLLTTSGKPIKVIAKECGFAYLSNFTAAFKKRFGKPPGVSRSSGLD